MTSTDPLRRKIGWGPLLVCLCVSGVLPQVVYTNSECRSSINNESQSFFVFVHLVNFVLISHLAQFDLNLISQGSSSLCCVLASHRDQTF